MSELTQTGDVIADRYRVDAVIGAGAMGAVLRCRHLGLGQDVAVKVLLPELCTRPDVAGRFAREAQSASRLDHPSCVRVLDFGSWVAKDGRAAKYLSMELLAGFELTRLLDRPMGVAQAMSLVRQMLDGLAHAHSRGVVHRDVKPQNVVIIPGPGGTNVVKLVDFGIAKILTGEGAGARMTAEGLICGTPHYMSPEQITGSPVDGRSDLYAVGVLLYRMLTASLPFPGTDLRVVMRMHLVDEPPPLPEHVPTPLRDFVATLLAKNRNHRHVSAAAARDELDEIIGGVSSAAPTRKTGDMPARPFETLDLSAALGGSDARAATRGRIAVRAGTTETSRPELPRADAPRRSRGKWLGLGAALSIAVVAIGLSEPDVYDRLVAPRENAGDRAGVEPLDRRRGDAVDLRSASEADAPCIAFAAALARVDRAGDPRDLALLSDVEVPSALADDDATTRAVCEQLPKLVLGVRTRLAKLERARPGSVATTLPRVP